MTKLQNYFKDFLPLSYHDFQVARNSMTASQSVVAELLRVCCEEDDVKAMRMAFERILGKPEKALIIKRVGLRVIYPEATTKLLKPAPTPIDHDDTALSKQPDDLVVLDESDAPGRLLRAEVDKIADLPSRYAYDVIEDKSQHPVAHVFAANVFAVAMRGGNLGAIDLLFNYIDGAIADVVRIGSDQVIVLEDYAEVAPHNAILGEDGVYYIEREAV